MNNDEMKVIKTNDFVICLAVIDTFNIAYCSSTGIIELINLYDNTVKPSLNLSCFTCEFKKTSRNDWVAATQKGLKFFSYDAVYHLFIPSSV